MNATNDRKPRALLLDDDPVVLRLLATALEARGIEVLAATDRDAGIALLLDVVLDLDVLVADDELPGLPGAALLDLVRRAGGERELAIAVLAPSAGRRERDRLRALGADEVLARGDGPDHAAAAVARLARAPADARRPPAARPGARPAHPLLPALAAMA